VGEAEGFVGRFEVTVEGGLRELSVSFQRLRCFSRGQTSGFDPGWGKTTVASDCTLASRLI